jgi:hypothetical protein
VPRLFTYQELTRAPNSGQAKRRFKDCSKANENGMFCRLAFFVLDELPEDYPPRKTTSQRGFIFSRASS